MKHAILAAIVAAFMAAMLIGCSNDAAPTGPNVNATPPPIPQISGLYRGVSIGGWDTVYVNIANDNNNITVTTTQGGFLPAGIQVHGDVRADSDIYFATDTYSQGDPETGTTISFIGKASSAYAFSGMLICTIRWQTEFYRNAVNFEKVN